MTQAKPATMGLRAVAATAVATAATTALLAATALPGGMGRPARAQQAAAPAPPRPTVLPARDVAVAYQVAGAAAQAVPGGVPGLLTLRWDAAGQRLRVEAEGRPQVALVDLPGHRATVLDAGVRSALVLPFSERDVGRLRLTGARFTRQAQDVVAGLPCTRYAVQHPSGRGTLCLTADGVPLRAEGEMDGRQGSFTAQRVEYGPAPPELFRVPDGYFRLDFNRGAISR